MSTSSTTTHSTFQELQIKPRTLSLARAELIRRVATTSDEPPLLETFLVASALTPFVSHLQRSMPADCSALVSSVLHWKHTDDMEMLLFDAEQLAALPTARVAAIICSIDPSIEARRAYAERLRALPIGAATISGINVNKKPLLALAATKNKPLVSATGLSPAERVQFEQFQTAWTAGDALYAAVQPTCNQVAAQMLLTDAAELRIDALTSWRIAAIATQSFTLSLCVRGFLHRDFVQQRCTSVTVRDKRYRVVGNDLMSNNIDKVLMPSTKRQEDHRTLDEQLGSDGNAQGNARRPPHLLDLLRTVLHLDSTGGDVVDIEELEMSANHRLHVLSTVVALALADPGATLTELAKRNEVSIEDRNIVKYYPRGYLAPRCVVYPDAPGLRSLATPLAYAALGLCVLCAAVRQDEQLLMWLQYAETQYARHTRVAESKIREHIEGIREFVVQTEEPDPDAEPLMSELINSLRRKIRATQVDRVRQRIIADEALIRIDTEPAGDDSEDFLI